MDWLELIRASRLLASGQPTQEALRRAISTAYYAMFHAMAASNANLLVGQKTPSNQSNWTSTYRSLRHFRAENPLYGWPHLFSPPVQNFAIIIAGIKRQREDADYNPDASFTQNQVITWIDRAEQAIIDFNNASSQERSMVAIATLAGQR
jgi:uncharacterized protein (UPF0332 family)